MRVTHARNISRRPPAPYTLLVLYPLPQATHLASILGNAIAAGLGGGSRPAYGSEEQLANSLLAQLAQMQAQQVCIKGMCISIVWGKGEGKQYALGGEEQLAQMQAQHGSKCVLRGCVL